MASLVGCLCDKLFLSYLHCKSGYSYEQYVVYFEICFQISCDAETSRFSL